MVRLLSRNITKWYACSNLYIDHFHFLQHCIGLAMWAVFDTCILVGMTMLHQSLSAN